jgi:hypothetical protein
MVADKEAASEVEAVGFVGTPSGPAAVASAFPASFAAPAAFPSSAGIPTILVHHVRANFDWNVCLDTISGGICCVVVFPASSPWLPPNRAPSDADAWVVADLGSNADRGWSFVNTVVGSFHGVRR